VPCITLAGERQVSRMGVTMLHALGMDELIASGGKDYFDKAVALANDIPRLVRFRASLRDRMRASPLGDAQAYMRDLESAYRKVWNDWCQREKAS